MTYKTQGVVIRRSNYKEADFLIKLFTKEKGKIAVIAKGARKIKSKLGSSLEPFYLNEYMLAEGKTLDTVCSSQPKKRRLFLRNDLRKMAYAYYLSEIIDKLLPERERNLKIYDLYNDALDFLEQDEELAAVYFELNIFKILGFGPVTDNCVSCHEDILESDSCGLSCDFGGTICPDCIKKGLRYQDISIGAIKYMRILSRFDLSVALKVREKEKMIRAIRSFNKEYLKIISHYPIKTEKFIANLS
ncbi:DNA repair protein RecO [bacterium CG2_30_37_16]|nr:MAG: DNA repair protein RecO [bacterium CG2_30_37_16]PIP31038.1 MAG: DNA repair protein RecO [bacterium (Candidatus Howlettbacteria) CG23_combo_of_CG06-09_8_20_14_all_37_9]PIX98825.1 MAG: DNA repair protein RecO [bacterium (Candidatus Howlettbacteria) CG_4_10_14_3_um_filter_37_10]PJB06919.1 MAG: DNA repair protein RecO [bacterium (Candidatus Howlettbacteria) CG_4_9_14_3_um_filter_37_10]